MGFILFIIALILLAVLSIVNTIFVPIYYIFSFKWKSGVKHLNHWFHQMALSIDQSGNVFCASLFNTLLIEKDGIKYGDEDDTISYITALNRNAGTLKYCGVLLAVILDMVDKGHLDKSIAAKREKDLEAVNRINNKN